MKATFFITYIMVDGWAGIAGEILMLKPLIIFHLKNFFMVKTEKDREEAMDKGSLGFNTGEPRIQFYFLLGLVYAVITPFLLPFIVIFFGLAFVVFRHQVIFCHHIFCIIKYLILNKIVIFVITESHTFIKLSIWSDNQHSGNWILLSSPSKIEVYLKVLMNLPRFLWSRNQKGDDNARELFVIARIFNHQEPCLECLKNKSLRIITCNNKRFSRNKISQSNLFQQF